MAAPTGSELIARLEAFAALAATRPLTLGEVVDDLGEQSHALIALVFALPFLSPVSLGPLSTLGGLAIAAVGAQWASGRDSTWVPARVRTIDMGPKTWATLLGIAARVVRLCARVSRPRLRGLLAGRTGRWLQGGVVMAAAVVLAVPLAGIPFNNTLPAVAILMACLAEMEGDGLLALGALGVCVLSAAYVAFILWVIFHYGLAAAFELVRFLELPLPW